MGERASSGLKSCVERSLGMSYLLEAVEWFTQVDLEGSLDLRILAARAVAERSLREAV